MDQANQDVLSKQQQLKVLDEQIEAKKLEYKQILAKSIDAADQLKKLLYDTEVARKEYSRVTKASGYLKM